MRTKPNNYKVICRLDSRRSLVRMNHTGDLTIVVDKKPHRTRRTSARSVYNAVGSALHRLVLADAV